MKIHEEHKKHLKLEAPRKDLEELARLRSRREAQSNRLWENGEGWASTIWLAGRAGEGYPNYLGMLKRMQRQAGLRRLFAQT